MSYNRQDGSVIPLPADDNMTDAWYVTTLNTSKYLPDDAPILESKPETCWVETSCEHDVGERGDIGPYGSQSLRRGWKSQSSLSSCSTRDTSESLGSEASSTDTFTSLEQTDIVFKCERDNPGPMSSIPFRPKPGHGELNDWGFPSPRSQSSHRGRREHTPSLPEIPDDPSVGSSPSKERSLTPKGRPTKPLDSLRDPAEELCLDNAGSDATVPAGDAMGRILDHTLGILGLHIDDLSHAPASCRNLVNNFISDMRWAVDEGIAMEPIWDGATSNATAPTEDATGRILHYTLDVLNLRIGGSSHAPASCRNLVNNLISEIARIADEGIAEKQLPMHVNECAGSSGLDRLPTNASGSSSGTGGSRNSSQSKRKCQHGGVGGQEGEDEFDDGASKGGPGGEPGPSKRQRCEQPKLRIGCPFRKKNPLRFNGRDHRTCAMTVFKEMSEVRRHIQDYHMRPRTSPHQCLRCRRQFVAESELRDHQLFPTGPCTILEASLGSHNPEDGIDKPIADRLRSKRDRVGDDDDVQWDGIWKLLFPDTPVVPYQFQAVMEHFELYQRFRASLPLLRASLSHIGLGGREDDLLTILENHFLGLFEELSEEGRQATYHNRQPKPKHAQLSAERGSLRELHQAGNGESEVKLDADLEAISSKASLSKVVDHGGAPPRNTQTRGVLGVEPRFSEPQPLGHFGSVRFGQPLDSSAFYNNYHGPTYQPMPFQLGAYVDFQHTYHGYTSQPMVELPTSSGGLPEHGLSHQSLGNTTGQEQWPATYPSNAGQEGNARRYEYQ